MNEKKSTHSFPLNLLRYRYPDEDVEDILVPDEPNIQALLETLERQGYYFVGKERWIPPIQHTGY